MPLRKAFNWGLLTVSRLAHEPHGIWRQYLRTLNHDSQQGREIVQAHLTDIPPPTRPHIRIVPKQLTKVVAKCYSHSNHIPLRIYTAISRLPVGLNFNNWWKRGNYQNRFKKKKPFKNQDYDLYLGRETKRIHFKWMTNAAQKQKQKLRSFRIGKSTWF